MSEEIIKSGSIQAVIYAFFQFVDEIFHLVELDRFEIGYRFCQWAHRKD